MTEPDMKRLNQAIETELKYEVEEMIVEAGNLLTGHPKQGTRPLLRLRVEYTDESQQLNSARFGNMFMETVSNAGDILLFKKKAADRKVKKDNFDMDAMNELGEGSNVTMEDLVMEYFNSQTDDKNQLSVLSVRGIGGAVKSYIEKDDKDAFKYNVDKTMERAYNTLLDRGEEDDDDLEGLSEHVGEEKVKKIDIGNKNRKGEKQGKQKDELFGSDEDNGAVMDSESDESVEDIPVKPVRGRGRGRAAGGRGRAAARSPAPKRGGRGRAPAQSTIAAAFARSQPAVRLTQTGGASQSQIARPSQRNKKQMFESDSDDDLLGAM